MLRFEGRVALVTGATRGIGRAIAVRLAADGAVVAVNHRRESDPQPTLNAIREAGGRGFAVVADMAKPQEILAMVEETAVRGGRLDFVVSNAAINPHIAWDATTFADWDRIADTNLRGTWVVCTESAKEMIREGHGGAIVCVSSISALVGAPDQTAYCATKAGISMLATALGTVLGAHGIRVNSVAPGAIRTDMSHRLSLDADVMRHYVDRIPLNRLGEPPEIASVVAFLLSDEASYVNSASLLVDAGFIANAEV